MLLQESGSYGIIMLWDMAYLEKAIQSYDAKKGIIFAVQVKPCSSIHARVQAKMSPVRCWWLSWWWKRSRMESA